MNGIDIEYEIKKDVRNNPIVRGADPRQRRGLARTVGIIVLALGMSLFSAWQHAEVRFNGYEIERLQQERAEEEALARKLRLEIETLRSPARIERLATTDLHMVAPAQADALVIERVTATTPDKAIVARVR